MTTTYEYAPGVEHIAQRLIPKHHPELIESGVHIAYVWRDKAASKGGKAVFGKARKVTGLNAYLARPDFGGEDFFVIEIAEDTWQILDKAQQEALVDHELSHCAAIWDEEKDQWKYMIRPHDCEEFVAIVRRHGLWKPDVEHLVSAAIQGSQLGLLDGLSDGVEAVTLINGDRSVTVTREPVGVGS